MLLEDWGGKKVPQNTSTFSFTLGRFEKNHNKRGINIVSYPTFVLDKGDRHWLRHKDGAVCVCVCVWEHPSRLRRGCLCSRAFCKKLNCSFQNKRASLWTNTTGGGFPFSRSLLKPFKQPPNKRHHSPSLTHSLTQLTHSLTHSQTHTQSPCLSVCLPLTHAHKQTRSQVLKGWKAAQLHSAKADTLDSHCQTGKEWNREEREPVTQGSKTFLLLWTRLTLWGHWQSTLSGEESALLADITLTSTTPGPESQFTGPSNSWYLHIFGLMKWKKNIYHTHRWSGEYQPHC